MGCFKKSEPCDSVRIWSREIMTLPMFDYGYKMFRRYNDDIQDGEACESGCIYSNTYYSVLARKTKGGCCSVMVSTVR